MLSLSILSGLLFGIYSTHGFTFRSQLGTTRIEIHHLLTNEYDDKFMDVKNIHHTMLKAIKMAQHGIDENIALKKGPVQLNSLTAVEMKPLFFHFDRLAVQVSNMYLTSGDVTVEESNMDVLGHKMMPVVHFPDAEISGTLTTSSQGITSLFHFRLQKNYLKGSGVMCLTADLACVLWSHFRFESESSTITLKSSETEDNENIFNILNTTQFRDVLSEKLQRDVNYQLSKIVSQYVNKTLNMSSKLTSLEPYSDEMNAIGINNTDHANMFIDNLLKVGQVMIRDQFGDRIKIPDIREEFSEKFLITFRGSFRTTEGSAIGTSSVYRVGDTVFGNNNDSLLHFYGILGFEALHLKYDRYKAEVWGVGPSGSVVTSLAPLSVLVHLHLNMSSKMITLNKFRIVDAGDLSVSLTGLGGMISWLVSRVTTWVVGVYRDQVLRLLEDQYEQYGHDVFATYNIEELLNGNNK